MKLIGLTGPKGVGKSTLADALVDVGWTRLYFAWALKEMLTRGFGINFHNMTTEEKETPLPDLGATPRYLMQTLGTEWGRALIARDIWIKLLRRRIELEREIDSGICIVVDDVRFDNEAEMLRLLGGKIVQVSRPCYIAPDGHVSEAGVSSSFIDHDAQLSDFWKHVTWNDRLRWLQSFLTGLELNQ